MATDSNACEGNEDEVAEYLESVALEEIKEERKAIGKLDQGIKLLYCCKKYVYFRTKGK